MYFIAFRYITLYEIRKVKSLKILFPLPMKKVIAFLVSLEEEDNHIHNLTHLHILLHLEDQARYNLVK
jgi:hypothetical protein